MNKKIHNILTKFKRKILLTLTIMIILSSATLATQSYRLNRNYQQVEERLNFSTMHHRLHLVTDSFTRNASSLIMGTHAVSDAQLVHEQNLAELDYVLESLNNLCTNEYELALLGNVIAYASHMRELEYSAIEAVRGNNSAQALGIIFGTEYIAYRDNFDSSLNIFATQVEHRMEAPGMRNITTVIVLGLQITFSIALLITLLAIFKNSKI